MWEGDQVPDENPFKDGCFRPPPIDQVEDEPQVLSIISHDGFVFCDETMAGDSQLTHTAMNITKPLKGIWHVIMDHDSQQACLMKQAQGADEQHMMLASELLDWDMYKHDVTGERFMVGHRGGKHVGEQESLDQLLCMHMEADVIVTVMSSVETTIPVSVFQHPRDFKSRVYWSLPHVYEFMGLTCHGSTPSKWIAKGKQA